MVGIDPGLSGGVTVLSADGRHVESVPMPTRRAKKGNQLDAAKLASLLRSIQARHEVRIVAVEEIQLVIRKGKAQGVVAAQTQGRSFGKIEGVLETLSIPYEIVPPKKWQQAILGKITSDKGVGLDYVKRRHPKVNLRPGRCTKDQDWISDSLCIAEHGRRLVQDKPARSKR